MVVEDDDDREATESRDREIPESITIVGVASSALGEKTKAEAGGAYR
jgi:hypothetical protein